MKNLSAILALAILLTVSLACSDSGNTTTTTTTTTNTANTATKKTDAANAATVEAVTMKNAADETVEQFKPTDLTQKMAVEFSETGAGKVRGVFTAVNAGGEKNVQILEKEMELTSMMNTANFTLTMPQAFPAGDYKLDVYLNGKLIKTHNYKVQ